MRGTIELPVVMPSAALEHAIVLQAQVYAVYVLKFRHF